MADETPFFLQAPGVPGAPPPQFAEPQAPAQAPPLQLPPLPQSGSIFQVPYLGAILDTMRDLVVGPNADYLSTQEQVTRGILNTAVLAKNPGALPSMYQGYSQADAGEFAKYQDPRFRERVRVLSDPNGLFRISEADAINRTADEFQMSKGVTRPTSLSQLPEEDPIARAKYKFGHVQGQAASELDKPESAYAPIGNFTSYQVKQAHDRQRAGVSLSPDDQAVLALEARQARIPGTTIDSITSKGDGAPTVKYKALPPSYIKQADGTYVDNTGRTLQGPGSPGVPNFPAGPPGSTLPNFDNLTTMILGEDAAGNLVPQAVPKPADVMEKEGLLRTKADIDVQKSGDIAAQHDLQESLRDYDFVNEIVGHYKTAKDPVTNETYTLDQNGQRYTGAPGQIRGGTGLYQFLNPAVFTQPVTQSDGSLIGDVKGYFTNKWEGFRQSIREGDKGNPANRLLGRYDAFVNERVPGYLKAARVTRTTQTEIDLLKQAFPNPKNMPLPMAMEMAEQLKGVMESRAATAALRLRQAQRHEKLTPYKEENITTSYGTVTIPAADGEIDLHDLKSVDSFAKGEDGEKVKPNAEPVETDDDIIMGDN
jgi:hypothetical protein